MLRSAKNLSDANVESGTIAFEICSSSSGSSLVRVAPSLATSMVFNSVHRGIHFFPATPTAAFNDPLSSSGPPPQTNGCNNTNEAELDEFLGSVDDYRGYPRFTPRSRKLMLNRRPDQKHFLTGMRTIPDIITTYHA